MGLTVDQVNGLQRLYLAAVYGNHRAVPVCQADLQAALLANNAGDPIATTVNPSIADVWRWPGSY